MIEKIERDDRIFLLSLQAIQRHALKSSLFLFLPMITIGIVLVAVSLFFLSSKLLSVIDVSVYVCMYVYACKRSLFFLFHPRWTVVAIVEMIVYAKRKKE